MATSLFRKRKQEHKHDAAVRSETAKTLMEHKQSIKKVRNVLEIADETLADEIRRLDLALERSK